ncbi:Putative Zn-dependent protease, contains TPR repeats [Collimonas sp. OK307]|uniref:M48 family metalloprotease n=1 Tax=Collimonas sp. OK307 TaxID=1801620 RepID=UPI0008E4BD7A|nr:M48 family metalloprotease [Collimonas sp. OK307]SFI08503.1 Putative Zn-dependent protease, contains TPR repeats [Collimonas sp. OK307]
MNRLSPSPRQLLLAALISACCALPTASILAAQNLPTLGDTSRGSLSPIMERKLGEEIMHDIRRDPDYMNDAPLLEYLNNFGLTLVAARPEVRGEAGFDFFFFAVRDPVLNAFALPGGFIGVHSGLLLAAQSESELASVLAHEIGHVAQRHIARMVGSQKQDSMIALASMLLGALAMRGSGDAGAAVMMGGTGLAMQRQLNFSRDAEREADRIGLSILDAGGFETSGMVAFFGRLQTASRNYSDVVPPYLLTHPLTAERIADIEARIREQRYRQRADSLDFQLIRARVRVLQDDTEQGRRDAQVVFDTQLLQNTKQQIVAAKYGMAFLAFRQGAYDKAEDLLRQAVAAALPAKQNLVLTDLGVEIMLATDRESEALKLVQQAQLQYPLSRGLAHQYARVLIAGKRLDDAEKCLREQAQLYRQDADVQDLLAKVYSAQGKRALQHMALAESYVLTGSVPAALDQLRIARNSADAGFYDQSMIDARERELQERWKEELKASKER